jgi:hypothetical protein
MERCNHHDERREMLISVRRGFKQSRDTSYTPKGECRLSPYELMRDPAGLTIAGGGPIPTPTPAQPEFPAGCCC